MDPLTFTFSSAGDGPTADVGSYPISYTVADPDGKLSNYTIVFTGANLVVGQATLDVTASVNTKTYSQTASDTGSVSGSQNMDPLTFTFSSAGDGPTADVGSYAISYTVADPDGKLSNYTIVYTGANLVVGQATLDVTASANTKTYGQTASDTGSVSGIQNMDPLTFTFSTPAMARRPMSARTRSRTPSRGRPTSKGTTRSSSPAPTSSSPRRRSR